MSASHEWTEWHLTTGGWVRGTEKTDLTFKVVLPPPNALATFIYSEEITFSGRPDEKVTCKWKAPSADAEIT